MRRPSKASGKAVKPQRRKTETVERRNVPKAAHGSSDATHETEVARLTRERDEALEQQVATSEVLKVIRRSPGDLKPVFAVILENATRLCQASFGQLYLVEGDAYRAVAMHNVPPVYVEARQRDPMVSMSGNSALARVAAEKRSVQIADVATDPAYRDDPSRRSFVKLTGARTIVAVPMLKDKMLIGTINVYRQDVRPFTEAQVGLLANFAAQAVIAIENARLLNELRQRTTDLSEALEQQTATSDVLGVISSSPGDLEPVFQSILENATRICEATLGILHLYENGAFRYVASRGALPAYVELRQREPVFKPSPEHPLAQIASTRQVFHIPDLTEGSEPVRGRLVELGGARTVLGVPMLKEDELVGTISIFRQHVQLFTDKQIELVRNFAAQAVIAIENARLLNELRERTTDLTEALEQQTATSEVLQTISSSPVDLEPVFAAMLEKAVRICDASFGNIYRWDGTFLHFVAGYNTPPAYVELRKRKPFRADNPFHVARMINTKSPVHTSDLSDEAYAEAVQVGGFKTVLFVPMLKEDDLVGAIVVTRSEVRPFTDKQIALVQNFAAQAVIAIENTRLLKELRERTEQVEKLNQNLEQRVADQVDEIERMGRLRRFLPPQVADLIVASGSERQLESHRREITALFCDLRGFTGFTESADAEDVMALLRDYHAASRRMHHQV